MMLTGDATKGAVAYAKTPTSCNSCHGNNGEGSLGPNISNSTTAGIGGWTQAQFHDAVRNGKAKNGMQLCMFMAPVTAKDMSDQEIADIWAFLKTKTSDAPMAGSYCGTLCTTCAGR